MSCKRIVFAFFICSLAACLISCLTFRYKQFVVGGIPRYPNEVVDLPDFSCGIQVDVEPSNEQEFQDSTYEVWVSLSRQNCTDSWPDVLASAEIKNISIIHKGINIQGIKDSVIRYSPCDFIWFYKDILIPDAVDTLRMELQLAYMKEGNSVTIDTTLTLFRLTGKKKDMWNF